MKPKIKKICDGCKNKFEVPDTIAGRKRKYCKQTCQIPWLKGKTGVYSPETIEKKRKASLNWIWSKDGARNREKTRLRNLSENNPWRHPKKEWIEKGQEKKKQTLIDHPEIKLKYASMKGKHHTPETIKRMKASREKVVFDKYGVDNVGKLDWVRKKISKTKTDAYASGKYKVYYGKRHPGWKGGYSKLIQLIYADRKLYKEWKYPILIRDGFKCTECGNTKKLQVHHDAEKLSDIYHKLTKNVDIENMTFKEKLSLRDLITDYHINKKISGITLCECCHKETHKKL